MVATILYVSFLFTVLTMVGVFAFVYSGKEEYSEGMVLGVHIPSTEINHEEVQNIATKYKTNLKKFNLWNLLLGTLICFLCFWNITICVILWTIWLFEYLVMGMSLIYVSHRKMYDIKMKHNWIIEGNTHIVHIDTVVSSMTKKLPISHWWNFIAVLGIGSLLCLPQIRKYFGANPIQWIFPITILLVSFLFWGLHLWLMRRNNIVYSTDSSVNMAMNRMEKRTWSVLLLSINYVNLLSWSYLTIKIISNQWLYVTDYEIFITLQMIPVIVIILGVVYLKRKRKEVLAMDRESLIVDDDEYWKNGWYNNPNDTHMWVQDRMCNSNYSMNMAKPAAKVYTVTTIAIITFIIVGVFALMIVFENSKITYRVTDNQVKIHATMYDTNFNINEIQSVELIEELPEDDFIRTNGGATEKYLIGHFEGRTTGKCMMYLNRGYVPILEIELADKIIYINSKKEDEVEEWCQELIKALAK